MSGEASNLVPKSLCLDLTDVIDDSLVHMEVIGQPIEERAQLAQLQMHGGGKSVTAKTRPFRGDQDCPLTQSPNSALSTKKLHLLSVVLLNECPGSSLNGLGSNSSLKCRNNSAVSEV